MYLPSGKLYTATNSSGKICVFENILNEPIHIIVVIPGVSLLTLLLSKFQIKLRAKERNRSKIPDLNLVNMCLFRVCCGRSYLRSNDLALDETRHYNFNLFKMK